MTPPSLHPGRLPPVKRVLHRTKEARAQDARRRMGEEGEEGRLFEEDVTVIDQVFPTSDYQSETLPATTLTSKTPKR